jgi:hypothetical protein
MATLIEAIRGDERIEAIEALLDGLDAAERWAQVRVLRPADQRRLYDAAAGRHTDLEFYVPEGVATDAEVIHDGVNTLPVIGGVFQKRFAVDPDDSTRLCGYNHNAEGLVSHLGWFTGPGYFLVREKGSESPDGRADHDGQLFINYYEQPSRAPVAGWPDPEPPMAWSADLVWGSMCDYMWRVSAHVSIGAAYKKGKQIGQFFALCRRDP